MAHSAQHIILPVPGSQTWVLCRARATGFVAGLRRRLPNVRGFYAAHIRISRASRGLVLPGLPEVPAALRIPRRGRPDSAGVRTYVCAMREFVQANARLIDKSMIARPEACRGIRKRLAGPLS